MHNLHVNEFCKHRFWVHFLNTEFVKYDPPFLRHSSTLSLTSAITLRRKSSGIFWISSSVRCFSTVTYLERQVCTLPSKQPHRTKSHALRSGNFASHWMSPLREMTQLGNIWRRTTIDAMAVQAVTPSCHHHSSPQLRPRQLIWGSTKGWSMLTYRADVTVAAAPFWSSKNTAWRLQKKPRYTIQSPWNCEADADGFYGGYRETNIGNSVYWYIPISTSELHLSLSDCSASLRHQ
jgi:hypothetical protein